MRVCIIMFMPYKDIFNKVAQKFIDAGHEVVFLAWTHFDEERIAKEFPTLPVYSPARYMQDNWDKLDTSELSLIQEKYNRYSFWDIFYSERRCRTFSKEEAAKYHLGYTKFLEEMFKREEIDFIFSEYINQYTHFMAKHIGSYYGAKYLGVTGTFFDSSRLFISWDDTLHYPAVTGYFKSDYRFTDEEIQIAESFIDDPIRRQGRAPYVKTATKKNNEFFKDFLAFFRFLRKIIFRRADYYNRYDYPLYKIKERYSMLYMRWFRWMGAKKYFERPYYDKEDYYLFPLHYYPDAVLIVSSRKYVDQASVIETLSKALPAGKMLYVKEHHYKLGHRHLSFYKRIAPLQNVRVIHPEESTYELIQNSYAVITIASTVGMEALMCGKSTFVLGEVYYDCLSSVTKIIDIFNEREKFWNPKPVIREEVVRFVCSLFKGSYKGILDRSNKNFTSDENATDIFKAILAEYDRSEK